MLTICSNSSKLQSAAGGDWFRRRTCFSRRLTSSFFCSSCSQRSYRLRRSARLSIGLYSGIWVATHRWHAYRRIHQLVAIELRVKFERRILVIRNVLKRLASGGGGVSLLRAFALWDPSIPGSNFTLSSVVRDPVPLTPTDLSSWLLWLRTALTLRDLALRLHFFTICDL